MVSHGSQRIHYVVCAYALKLTMSAPDFNVMAKLRGKISHFNFLPNSLHVFLLISLHLIRKERKNTQWSSACYRHPWQEP